MAQVLLDSKEERLLEICKKLYLDIHPELEQVYISKHKIIYETLKFYLKKTKYETLIYENDEY